MTDRVTSRVRQRRSCLVSVQSLLLSYVIMFVFGRQDTHEMILVFCEFVFVFCEFMFSVASGVKRGVVNNQSGVVHPDGCPTQIPKKSCKKMFHNKGISNHDGKK